MEVGRASLSLNIHENTIYTSIWCGPVRIMSSMRVVPFPANTSQPYLNLSAFYSLYSWEHQHKTEIQHSSPLETVAIVLG